MPREVRAGTGCRHASLNECGDPGLRARRQSQPGRGIRLDDIWRGPARVPRTLDRLDSAERWDANLDRVARRLLGQKLEQVPHGRGRRIPTGRSAERRAHGRLTDIVSNPSPRHLFTVSRCR
jgi:hypothetical protein